MNTKRTIIAVSLAGLFVSMAAHAATENASFDPGSGNLSITGTCAERYVLLIIRRSADNSIWGSSNPDCVKGAYAFSIPVTDADRTGGTFNVQAFDENALGGAVPASAVGGGGGGGLQPVVFSAPVRTTAIATATIVADTSSIGVAPYDPSPVDAVLSQFFGVVADITDAVSTFTTVVANTVKTSLLAVVDLFAKNATILPGGSITVPSGENEVSGENTLNVGALTVFVSDTAITSSSRIILTPNTPLAVPLAVTDKEPGVGFTVGVQSAQTTPIVFDWFVVQTYAAAPAAHARSADIVSAPAPPADVPAVSDAAPQADTSSSPDASVDVSPPEPPAPPSDASGTPTSVPDDMSQATDTVQ